MFLLLLTSCMESNDFGATIGDCDEFYTIYHTSQLELMKEYDIYDKNFPDKETRRGHIKKISNGHKIESWFYIINDIDTNYIEFSCIVNYDSNKISYVTKDLEVRDNASIKYNLSLGRSKYFQKDTVGITLTIENTSNIKQSIWFDAGQYPTGTGIKLFNDKNEPQIKKYWDVVSSDAYTLEQVKEKENHLKPGQSFSKSYNLRNIIQLDTESLKAGKYYMYYEYENNKTDTISFEIL